MRYAVSKGVAQNTGVVSRLLRPYMYMVGDFTADSDLLPWKMKLVLILKRKESNQFLRFYSIK